MASQVDITNRALLSIGSRSQVSSISPSDGSVEANAASVLFTPTFEALARAAHWGCLRDQETLTLLAAAAGTPENPDGTQMPLPPTPWQYAYLYPPECLAVRFITPSLPSAGGQPPTSYNNAALTILPGQGQVPFVTAYSNQFGTDGTGTKIILTDQSQAQIVFTVNQPNPVFWDSQFQAAMVASLAAYFVPALAMNAPLMQGAIASAERIIMQARVADGNEGVTSMDHVPDWIRARSGGSGYGLGLGWNGYGYGGWANMAWPC